MTGRDTFILGLLAAAGPIVAGVLAWRNGRRANVTASAQTAVDGFDRLTARQAAEIDDLRDQLDHGRRERERLATELDRLRHQLADRGIIDPHPTEGDPHGP